MNYSYRANSKVGGRPSARLPPEGIVQQMLIHDFFLVFLITAGGISRVEAIFRIHCFPNFSYRGNPTAGGRPSVWLPPEGLVEQRHVETSVKECDFFNREMFSKSNVDNRIC